MARKQSSSIQAPNTVVMIRPHHFTVNTQTAVDNSFQIEASLNTDLASRAFYEITKASDLSLIHI